MQSVLIVIHILIVVALIGVVLLQRSEGGALGTGGGTGSFMTGRGQANALSRATAILGALFFATALLMSILSSWSRAPHSILDKGPPPAGQTAPTPISPGNLLDQLKQMGGQSSAPSPAAPRQPRLLQPRLLRPRPRQPHPLQPRRRNPSDGPKAERRRSANPCLCSATSAAFATTPFRCSISSLTSSAIRNSFRYATR